MKNFLSIAGALLITSGFVLLAFAIFLGSLWLSYILVGAVIVVVLFLFIRSAIIFKAEESNPPESDQEDPLRPSLD